MRGKPLVRAVLSLGTAALLMGACVGSGVDTYDEFEGAIDGGAPCNQLFEMRENFDDAADLERIDADLDRIGCNGRSSERTDR
ncbi:MAG: hypothetical protein ACRDKT_00700 [Actinomycetota bacterium]